MFKQIDERLRHASLRPIAVLRHEPAYFTDRYGITFVVNPDRPDGTVAALLEIHPGAQYMVLRDLDAPYSGVDLLAAEDSRDPRRDVHKFLDAFGLKEDSVSWVLDGV